MDDFGEGLRGRGLNLKFIGEAANLQKQAGQNYLKSNLDWVNLR